MMHGPGHLDHDFGKILDIPVGECLLDQLPAAAVIVALADEDSRF